MFTYVLVLVLFLKITLSNWFVWKQFAISHTLSLLFFYIDPVFFCAYYIDSDDESVKGEDEDDQNDFRG